MTSKKGFIAVHVGAGYHSPTNSELYKDICNQACLQAISLLKENRSAVEVATAAIKKLEDSPWTNAGIGSNLTLDGNVECDASIMDGKTLQFGAVGATKGVLNPIELAENILQTQLAGNLSMGRIPPSTLVGSGATEWAKKRLIQTVDACSLITENSKKSYVKHKRKLDILEDSSCHRKKVKKSDEYHEDCNATNRITGRGDSIQDTVGAVCIDSEGNIASGVSSGGILLKQPGRIGQAAVYGCGCWAINNPDTHTNVGVSTTGSGELLIKTLLAKECADSLISSTDPTAALAHVFNKGFLESPFLKHTRHDQKLAGTLAIKLDTGSSQYNGEVFWAHTSDSMCLAYMSTDDSKPTALVSRLPDEKSCGKCVIIQSRSFSL